MKKKLNLLQILRHQISSRETAKQREKNDERCFDIFVHASQFSFSLMIIIKALATNLILIKLMCDLQTIYPYPFQHNNDHHSVVTRWRFKKELSFTKYNNSVRCWHVIHYKKRHKMMLIVAHLKKTACIVLLASREHSSVKIIYLYFYISNTFQLHTPSYM